MSRYFPLFIDLTGRKILLFGAGTIAARRLRGLVSFGAQVTVVAPEVSAAIQTIAEQFEDVRVEQRRYQLGEIAEADFVLSCCDDQETDRLIYQECRSKGIPVNIASDRTLCDFYFPALIEQEELTIGVCSGGEDHTRVRQVSAQLRAVLREEEDNADDSNWKP